MVDLKPAVFKQWNQETSGAAKSNHSVIRIQLSRAFDCARDALLNVVVAHTEAKPRI
jgi:hypothetical protein